MAGGDDDTKQDGAQITSVSGKELKFDDKTGRFFETNLDECIPDEEFCAINEDTGEKMRLTMAEKERIFLDALQVRLVLLCCFVFLVCSLAVFTCLLVSV